jgi:hypothetical protein
MAGVAGLPLEPEARLAPWWRSVVDWEGFPGWMVGSRGENGALPRPLAAVGELGVGDDCFAVAAQTPLSHVGYLEAARVFRSSQ